MLVISHENKTPLTESQFFQRSPLSLGVEEINHNDFNANSHTIHDKIFPTDIGHANGIYKCGKKVGCADEKLFDGDAAGAIGVGEEFY